MPSMRRPGRGRVATALGAPADRAPVEVATRKPRVYWKQHPTPVPASVACGAEWAVAAPARAATARVTAATSRRMASSPFI
jgi:hypothetical protein